MPSLDGLLLCIGELERSGQVVIAIAVLSGCLKRCVTAARRPIFARGARRASAEERMLCRHAPWPDAVFAGGGGPYW